MSLKAVKKAAQRGEKKRGDEFVDGTVIRWTASKRYMYAAIKTPVGWYTTASTAAAAYTPQVVDFEKLLEIIGRAETTQVAISATWSLLTGDGEVTVDNALQQEMKLMGSRTVGEYAQRVTEPSYYDKDNASYSEGEGDDDDGVAEDPRFEGMPPMIRDIIEKATASGIPVMVSRI